MNAGHSQNRCHAETISLEFADGEKRARRISRLNNISLALIRFALFFTVVLLLSSMRSIPEKAHGYLSSVPLALAGIGYALLQIALRPARGTLLKRLLLAATFVGWAVDQVLPAGPVAIFIGDMVIAAYVLDLYWIARDQISVDHNQPQSAQSSPV